MRGRPVSCWRLTSWPASRRPGAGCGHRSLAGPQQCAGAPPPVRRGSPALAFRVSDTGIGISDQHLENIFGAFQQADGTTSRKYGGTGLGLSICREIAYLLGGSIHAQSTQDEGSCFTLYLPTVHPAVQDTAAPPAAAAAPAAAGPGAEPRDRRGTAPGSLGRHGEAGLAADAHGAPPAGRRVLVVEASPRGPLSLLTESAVADLPVVPTPRPGGHRAADPGVAAASTPSRPFSAYGTRRLD